MGLHRQVEVVLFGKVVYNKRHKGSFMAEEKAKKKTTETKAKKKTSKRKMTPLLRLFCYIMIFVSGLLLWRVFDEVYTTMTLKKQLAEVQEKYQKVLDENAYLTSEREKLEDPDYVASYARGTYLLSKDDEQIFYLPEDENK
jgi:cell division protein DivIC